jgi:HPt (histidine-containing phosphotransfer) domain-containing protein
MQSESEPVWALEGGLNDLLADDGEAIVVEILELYLADSAVLLDGILAAYARGERAPMPALLHRLKGSALQAGAARLGARVRAAESAAKAGDFTSPAYVAPMDALRGEWALGAAEIRAWLANHSH